MKLKIQPLILGKGISKSWEEAPVMAAEAWVDGPVKPRHKLREKEVPPKDVGLKNLRDRGAVEVCERKRIEKPGELEEIPEDVDAFFLHVFESSLASDEIFEKLASMEKPILGNWDNWGFSWYGRFSNLRSEKYSEAKYFWPFGASDVAEILNALRAWKRLRSAKIIYIGSIPSHSVEAGHRTFDFDYLHERFGTRFVRLDFSDYQEAAESVDDDAATELAKKWREKYDVVDERKKELEFYSRIYLGLKKLLKKHGSKSITMDCAWLPSVEYVPCFAFSNLIDEGVAAGCEGDIPALYMMNAMMEISKNPAMMGNLNENAIRSDIESDVVVINHDVVPPSMGCPKCRLKLRNFHATQKGLTPYVDLEKGRTVTLAGMHQQDMNKIWAARGNVQWSKDTTHCRISVGVKVEDAKKVSKNAFGHHISMVYGDYRNSLEKLADLLEMKCVFL